MKIEIVYPGKIKNAFAKAGFEEYMKRCKRFFKVKVTALHSSKVKDIDRVVKEEGEKIEKYLSSREYILLDVDGIQKNTPEFFELVKSHIDRGKELIFVVGGVYGVSKGVKEKAALRLSLSPLTFTHSLSLLILAEQIYRSLKIYVGQPYDH